MNASPATQNTAFGRYECKYLITEDEARAIEAFVSPHCRPDPMLAGGDDDYIITSLYFDSPALHLYWAKKTLQFARFKVRVRTYGFHCDGPVFIEVKRRYGDIVVKGRAKVSRTLWPLMLHPPTEAAPLLAPLRPSERDVLHEVRTHCAMLALQPLVLVRYNRRPLIGELDGRIRVTFDRGLRYRANTDFDFHPIERDYWPADFARVFGTPDSRVILEMKFNDRAPWWMPHVVRRFDLLRGAFSKYCTAVDEVLGASRDFAGRDAISLVR